MGGTMVPQLKLNNLWSRLCDLRFAINLRSAMGIISIHNLVVRRGNTEILRDLHWQVNEQEHWVILGPNGSGKTTLLSCITGYVTPSRGIIQVLGRQYGKSDWRDLRKEVGLVSSSIRQLIEDCQTAVEVVASGRDAELNLWHPPKGQLKSGAVEALEQVECGHLADRAWGHLSQGERQRTLIGRALMANYKVLILDEPCAGLDPVARERFLDFVNRLADSNRVPSLLFVTHHVEEILPCFADAIVLRDGKIVAQGPIAQVVNTVVLSEAFGVPLIVRRRYGRFSVRIGGI
jgi:iron complex transport system ATP-binding protein